MWWHSVLNHDMLCIETLMKSFGTSQTRVLNTSLQLVSRIQYQKLDVQSNYHLGSCNRSELPINQSQLQVNQHHRTVSRIFGCELGPCQQVEWLVDQHKAVTRKWGYNRYIQIVCTKRGLCHQRWDRRWLLRCGHRPWRSSYGEERARN